jgi:hypothetical protein
MRRAMNLLLLAGSLLVPLNAQTWSEGLERARGLMPGQPLSDAAVRRLFQN